jgi:lauroyl/myristoyl acyltransferase
VLFLTRSIERHVRRALGSERNRRRFDRAKRFVDETIRRAEADTSTVSYRGGHGIDYTYVLDKPSSPSTASAYRVYARWLKFLCAQSCVQKDIWPEQVRFLHHFATAFGMAPADVPEFITLSLLGRVWRTWSSRDLASGTPELLTELTQVKGWGRFEHYLREGKGVILLPVHGQFARLFQQYLRHRGHEGLKLGQPSDKLEQKGAQTPAAKKLELARQMHAAKHRLSRGGIVFNLPDAPQNLDNARTVEFFGRERPLATGFAELALLTGARVLPVAYRFSPRGFFVMELGAPFRVPEPESSDAYRVDALVAQYADFLRREWRSYPWNIQWEHLRYYCGPAPELEAGTLRETARGGRSAEFSLEFEPSRSA